MNEEMTKKSQKAGRKNTDDACLQRRKKLLKFISKFGTENFNAEAWAKENGIQERQAYRDLAWLKEHRTVDVISADVIKFRTHEGLSLLQAQARLKMLSAEKDSDKREWGRLYLQTSGELTKFLEDFGAKPKTPTLTVTTSASLNDAFEAYEQAVKENGTGRTQGTE